MTGTWTSLTSGDLLVSLRVPLGWEVAANEANSFRIQAPDAARGYRATLTVEGGEPEEPGPQWFETFADSVVAEVASVPGLEVIGTDRFSLSSKAEVVAIRARRDPRDDSTVGATSQLQAWIWAGRYRMLVVGGSTLRADEERDLPLFDTMLRSVRLLPPRPTR